MSSPIRVIDQPEFYAQLVEFARLLYATGELDPYYPLIRELTREADEERALWLVALYTAYYNFTSAFYVWNRTAPLEIPTEECFRLPFHFERRGLRGGKIARHLRSYRDRVLGVGSQRDFLRRGWGDDPIQNYLVFWDTIQTVHQNGRYFAFKWAEILKVSFGWPLTAPDMRMKYCSGPIRGLEIIYGLEPKTPLADLDRCGADLMERLQTSGVPVDGWEQLETILCGYHQLREGRYYVGADIDVNQREIHESPYLTQAEKNRLYAAREAALPRSSLGELNGWFGDDRRLYRLYPEFGALFHRGLK